MSRTADQIATTPTGPRALPGLASQALAREFTAVTSTLDSGLRVLLVHRPTVPMVELRLAVPFAAAPGTDAARHAATAEVLAETLLAGTARRDRLAVDSALAAVGAELGAGVDPETLSMSGTVLAEGLGELLDVLGDVLSGATYPDAEVDGERDRLVERLGVARSQPGVLAREALLRHTVGDHPSVHEVPAAALVGEVAADEVRALHAAALLPRGSLLVLVGDLEPDTALDQVRGALGAWTGDGSAQVIAPWPALPTGPSVLVDRTGAVQSQVRLAAPGVSRHDEHYAAAQLANLVFGGYFSSRLMENLREDKGYTYGASTGFDATPAGVVLTLAFDTSGETTAAAVAETFAELARTQQVPATDDEIASARQYAVGALLLSLATQGGLAGNLVRLLPLGLDPDWVRRHPERLAAVTDEQVRTQLRELFAPERFTGIVQSDADSVGAALGELGVVAG